MTTPNGRRRPPLQIRATRDFMGLIDSAARRDAREGGEESDEGRAPAARALILIGAAALGRDMRHLRAEILKALAAPLAPDVDEALHALLEGATISLPHTVVGPVGVDSMPLAALDDPPGGGDPFDVGQEF
jgi:hypothetical protein